ncbi:dienelactone hydrolase family protein [Vibrio hannami]|uniref:dienelactone hydrolase family protein n=1 Tax=Vibrio hannami TaxID=2717094 RepID=UPI00240F4C41|nr:dienelactone hydrolase family protein [Vibrio hannami]MDG3087453.1 dienelactone hydrolase family protein [Vibrio hannami]
MAQESINYQTESAQYEGYLVKPTQSGDLDGVSVLFAHDFLGPGENQLSLAREYADRGALSFVADFYGSNVRPSNPEEANIEAMRVRQNVPELRAAMKEALSEVVAAGGKKEKTVVIGTSVGGLAAIELGRSGESVNTIITMWGVLENTQPETASAIKSNVVLLQGDIDPLTSKAAIDAIEDEFSKNQTSYEVVLYKDTAHAFTLPFVGTDASTGFAYNEQSAKDASDRISSILVKAAKQ